MTAGPELTAPLRSEVSRLEGDLRSRLANLPEVREAWDAEYAMACQRERTAASWDEWSGERITQAAVAWVLITVFVRFCEDNDLVEPVWITGPDWKREQAIDAQTAFLRERSATDPDVTDRDWLLQAVAYFRDHPATALLVEDESPLWQLYPSGDAATRLLEFWRERDEQDQPVWDLSDSAELDTRFLGDLYQNLSESARERYALKQTPEFVEKFILDQTLTPALKERSLERIRVIDPTCGSGHFLLGAFDTLLDRWHAYAPALDDRERVQRALDAVHGVDINPFAVAIARFRLTIAALRACGEKRLEKAPAFRYHLAAGDSLLHGLDQGELDLGMAYTADTSLSGFAYSTENLDTLRSILQNDTYDVVVGNPPYITARDSALNNAYRERYKTCHLTYALTVPFMERFFGLARSGSAAGWVGQITSNSFMKRNFGKNLIQKFLPRKDVTLIADTSGAYIPGHGTPTLIISGRNREPQASTVRAVLGIRGEDTQPKNPSEGEVWRSIADHASLPGYSDQWVSVEDVERSALAAHPWSLTGGGATQLQQAIEVANIQNLQKKISRPIGRSIRAGADEAFMRTRPHAVSGKIPENDLRSLVIGEVVRDWRARTTDFIWYPYVYGTNDSTDLGLSRELWQLRTLLAKRGTFQGDMSDAKREWWEYMQHTASAYVTPLSIVFAFVATHNHFVLDRGGKVFKQTAPVIKLPEGTSEDDHVALLGVLNSSTACFWLKQNSHNKGEGGGARVDAGYAARGEPFREAYEFTGTILEKFPLPAELPLERGRELDALAQRLGEVTPRAVCEREAPTREALDAARQEHARIRAEMVARQEELDWDVYRRYALVDEDLTYHGDDLPPLELGQRAFEIVLARRMARGEEETSWFERHGSTPITEPPADWPEDYRRLIERRIELIESHRFVGLLEKPEHKRRWSAEPWEKQEREALQSWLLDRLEDEKFWFDRQGRPTPKSVAVLADEVARDHELTAVLRLWQGRSDVDVGTSLRTLLADEPVPFLAAYRYTESGMRKRRAWEDTWRMQRQEDSGEPPTDANGRTVASIPVPPKYTKADFAHGSYWGHRGKLDVPKERFIGYPDANRDTDPTPVLGWAGWDHAQQALALAQVIQERITDGWEDDRLIPLVAGLDGLLPWIEQWHAEPDPFYGGVTPADFFTEQLDTRAREIGYTRDELAAWRPERKRRGRSRRTSSASTAARKETE